MDFIIDNYEAIIGGLGIILVIITNILEFTKLTSSEKMDIFKTYLLKYVTEAEVKFEHGDNDAKLKYVYDCICERLPWVKTLIKQEQFNDFVDEALDVLKGQIPSLGGNK